MVVFCLRKCSGTVPNPWAPCGIVVPCSRLVCASKKYPASVGRLRHPLLTGAASHARIRAMIRPSGPPARYEFPARADELETRHEP